MSCKGTIRIRHVLERGPCNSQPIYDFACRLPSGAQPINLMSEPSCALFHDGPDLVSCYDTPEVICKIACGGHASLVLHSFGDTGGFEWGLQLTLDSFMSSNSQRMVNTHSNQLFRRPNTSSPLTLSRSYLDAATLNSNRTSTAFKEESIGLTKTRRPGVSITLADKETELWGNNIQRTSTETGPADFLISWRSG